MWIFTPSGIYSCVQLCDDADWIQVRGRVREDLAAFAKLPYRTDGDNKEIKVTPDNDYPYRLLLQREDFVNALALLGDSIDYDNFKSAVQERQGKERHDLCSKVWGLLWDTFAHLRPAPKVSRRR